MTETPRKHKRSLAPIEDVTEEEIDKMLDMPGTITEESGLDNYERAQVNEIKEELKDIERGEISKELISLRENVEILTEKNKSLMEEISNLKDVAKKSISCDTYSERNERLEQENDSLILKNGELEYELSRCRSEINRLQNELVKLNRQFADSINTYTRPPQQPHIPPNRCTRMTNGYHTGMNGYQVWN